MGVPESDEKELLRLTLELFGVMDPEFSRAKGGSQTSTEVAQNFMAEIFGYSQGVHANRVAHPGDDIACLGQHLARLEMRLLFEEILPHIRTLELAGPIRSMCGFQTSGPKTVPIRFAMA